MFRATTIGTSAARAWLIASSVCGITPSSAATTSTAMSVTLAPRAAHFREGLVAGRIDEGHGPAVGCDPVGADVLGDAAFLVRGHVDADDPIQQRRLAVVHVAEEGHDRRSRLELCRVVFLQRLNHLLVRGRSAAGSSPGRPTPPPAIRPCPGSKVAAILLIAPSSSSLPRMVRAGTPTASEKLLTVHGNSSVTFSRRGAAVLAPVRRMCVRLRSDGAPPSSPSSSGFRPPGGGGFLAFQLPLLAAAERGRRALFLFSTAAGRAAAAGPIAARQAAQCPLPAGAGAAAGEVLSPCAASRRCSCLRSCSASGLVPALLARMASAGSFRSGFCGAGSGRFGPRQPAAGRQRRQLDRRSSAFLASIGRLRFDLLLGLLFFLPLLFPLLLPVGPRQRRQSRRPNSRRTSRRRRPRPVRPLATAMSQAAAQPAVQPAAQASGVGRAAGGGSPAGAAGGFLLSRGGLSLGFGGQDRDLGPDRRAGRGDVVFSPERSRRAGRAAFTPRGGPVADGPAGLAPLVDEGGDGRRLLVGQTGQRRALPRHTCLLADVDQHLAVELQLFR